jgi:hypothetical protein
LEKGNLQSKLKKSNNIYNRRQKGMTKKRLIIISSIVSAVIVLMGLIGGTVLAATPTPTPGTATNPQSVFAAKVAGILGIDQAKVETAFTQAQKEMKADAQAKMLAKLVADGKMTQAQADQYKTWLDSKPNVPGIAGPQGGRGGMMGRGFGCPPGGFGGPGPRMGAPAKTPAPTTTN